MLKNKTHEIVEVVRERERESKSLEKVGFDFDARKLIKYIAIKRIEFLREKKRIQLLRESLSFL